MYEDCSFTVKTVETREVHVGRCRIEHIECGLWNFKADTLEKFDIRLVGSEFMSVKIVK